MRGVPVRGGGWGTQGIRTPMSIRVDNSFSCPAVLPYALPVRRSPYLPCSAAAGGCFRVAARRAPTPEVPDGTSAAASTDPPSSGNLPRLVSMAAPLCMAQSESADLGKGAGCSGLSVKT